MTEVKARANALLHEAAVPTLGEIEATLRDLGLTGYAAQVFCAALGSSQTTAGDLVLKTGIPDSKIYYALGELVDRGLLEVQAGKPKLYRVGRAKEVEARLKRLIEAKHERERAAVTRVASLLEPLQAGAQAPTTDLAYVVKGQPNVFARASSMIASARRVVVVLTSEEPVLRAVEDALDRASKRRVRVKLAGPLIPLVPGIGRAAETRQILCDCVLTLVVDGEQILTANRTGDGSMYGITSTDATLVKLGLEYWESPRCCAG
ncbi:MAG TPA: helix-turn-helix domain-containing protein [Candidatus Thermoplasmatota archaeon]|nr:helix-turn-helix domain-containing protein [Candidatus Thermoplasmatota archaeon]